MLIEYQGQFSAKEGDIGRTELVKHRIETGNTVPIGQRPRRLPLHQRGVAEAEIDSMLKRGYNQTSYRAMGITNRPSAEEGWEGAFLRRLPAVELGDTEGCISYTPHRRYDWHTIRV